MIRCAIVTNGSNRSDLNGSFNAISLALSDPKMLLIRNLSLNTMDIEGEEAMVGLNPSPTAAAAAAAVLSVFSHSNHPIVPSLTPPLPAIRDVNVTVYVDSAGTYALENKFSTPDRLQLLSPSMSYLEFLSDTADIRLQSKSLTDSRLSAGQCTAEPRVNVVLNSREPCYQGKKEPSKQGWKSQIYVNLSHFMCENMIKTRKMRKFSKQEDISINPTWIYSVYTVLGTCRELLNDFRADLMSASQATEEEIRDGAVRRGCRKERTGQGGVRQVCSSRGGWEFV